ncbi:iron-sulfur cluster assembly scaffold protein [Ureaplasma miroungigenitalium]|uniref:Iron-sulfur cluster assembly scaffold protein n=1 Tax=Ureaplasma miroungigenitalium TaxID=1042321 RepID=A0ABT3BNG9_9BACT|nr:iron-sulfur cluster assembly scaffold protein [Ureaplasma miroungigenitalium]MCV3728562.1 iron-sulfur cluster assembly scaffold protein [Ureaplasma miroungigenitalium]MCV3734431.1 iron-sulfur cluster assembly scaffold protein [Ureaplasma miroungigenitalium]
MGSFKNKDPLLLRNIIMQHYEKPDNRISDPLGDDYLQFRNRIESCIDDITVFMKIKDDIVTEIKFLGTGCAIATASTDIMLNCLVNKHLNDVKIIIAEYEKMLLNQEYNEDLLDELIAFYNVKKQPNRIRCGLNGILAIKECIKTYGQ